MLTTRRIQVLNLAIDQCGSDAALERLRESRVVFTPNMDHLWNLQKNAQFYRVYAGADLVLCDSRVLSRLLAIGGLRLEALPGSEFFPEACRRYAPDPNFRVFLLGGSTAEHARLAATRLAASTGVNIVGAYSPPFGFERDEEEIERICGFIRGSRATLVGVGVGSPKQELVIARLVEEFPKGVTFIGIGATVDFESGLLVRAPAIWRWLCLEWLYRVIQEPRRLFRRYFVYDVKVLFLLFRQSIGQYKNPFG